MCNFLPKIKVYVGLFLGLLVSFSKTSFSIKNFGLKKNFRYQSQKCWPQNKVSESVLMKISVSSSLSSSQPRGRRRSSIQQINRSCNQPPTRVWQICNIDFFCEQQRLFVKHFKSTQNIIVKFFCVCTKHL